MDKPTPESIARHEAYIRWRDALLNRIGREMAPHFPGFHGYIQFNFQNGQYVCPKIFEAGTPEKK